MSTPTPVFAKEILKYRDKSLASLRSIKGLALTSMGQDLFLLSVVTINKF